jgi:hypothetical protein
MSTVASARRSFLSSWSESAPLGPGWRTRTEASRPEVNSGPEAGLRVGDGGATSGHGLRQMSVPDGADFVHVSGDCRESAP